MDFVLETVSIFDFFTKCIFWTPELSTGPGDFRGRGSSLVALKRLPKVLPGMSKLLETLLLESGVSEMYGAESKKQYNMFLSASAHLHGIATLL